MLQLLKEYAFYTVCIYIRFLAEQIMENTLLKTK